MLDNSPASCPCCGQSVAAEGKPPLHDMKLMAGPTAAKALAFVATRPGADLRDIVDHVYAMRSDGGPENAESTIKVTLSNANRKWRNLGWEVSCGRGKRDGYFLRRAAR